MDFTNPTDFSENDLRKIASEALAPDAVALIEEYLGRKVMLATYTEFYTGDGHRFFPLRQRPVQSITSLHLDERGYWGDRQGAFDATSLLAEGEDYALDRDQPDGSSRSGLVYKIGGYWPQPVTRDRGRMVIGAQKRTTCGAGSASKMDPPQRPLLQ